MEYSEDGGVTWETGTTTEENTNSYTFTEGTFDDTSLLEFRINASFSGGTSTLTSGNTTPISDPSNGADTDGDGIPDSIDTDDDNDGLSDQFEGSIGTQPKNPDSDGDSVPDGEDGWPLCGQLAPAWENSNYSVVTIKQITGTLNFNTAINNQNGIFLEINDSNNLSRYFCDLANLGTVNSLPEDSTYKYFTENHYFIRKTQNTSPSQVFLYQEGSVISELSPPDGLISNSEPHSPGHSNLEVNGLSKGGISYGTASQTFYSNQRAAVTDIFLAVEWSSAGAVSAHTSNTLSKDSDWTQAYYYYSEQGNLEELIDININNVAVAKTTSSLNYWLRTDSDADGNETTETGGSRNVSLAYMSDGTFNTLDGLLGIYTRINNQNTIQQGSTLWLDANAGFRNDQPVDGSPSYNRIDWQASWGDTPPPNLNAQMVGFDETRIWRNTRWENIDELVQSDEWTDIKIKDINDHGTCIAQATKNGNNYAVMLLKVDIVPDWDRNGEINQLDRNKATESNPFRFWVNDDDDSGEVDNDDVPQQGNDADANSGFSGRVDGMRDLVDFFPLFFDLEDFLESFDDLSTVNLKLSGQGMRFLKYDDGYAGFTPDEAGKFLRDVPTARELADDDTRSISTDPNSPTDLGAEFVTLASEGKGVLLLESYAATDQPLKLHVFVNGNELFTYDFHLKTSTVEDMFEHRDLTGIPKDYDGSAANVPSTPASARTTAPNWPDELTNGKTFAFVHGYKVSGQGARGWQAEVFKRMHQMGSNARFVGITWNGDTGLDYHKAVFHALQTGQSFNASLGGDVTIAAHSLGNMVVSQAIQSGSLIPNRYYMLNAATPNEAYGTGGSSTDMVEQDWTSIGSSFYASNWYQQFSGGDARGGLTWKGAFSLVSQIETHNFYSSGEDVLHKRPGLNNASTLGQVLSGNFNFGFGAWKSQELVKGKTGFESLASLALSRSQAGWRLNGDYEAGDDIKLIPRFKPFLESDLTGVDQTLASNKAGQTDPNVRFDLLARGIPALSDAAAVDTVPGVTNFNMQTSGRDPAVWPTEDHSGVGAGNWIHSDFRNVALPYVSLMYEAMINRGGLDHE